LDKVIDLSAYKQVVRERGEERERREREEAANTLCEEAWQLLIPMRLLKIRQLTIDASGIIVNIKSQEADCDGPDLC
jgi:hypothetical protein